MRTLSIIILIILIFTNCSDNKQTEPIKYAQNGALLTFDTLSHRYVISKNDTKLISSWALFKQAILTTGYKDLKQLSTDSIICSICSIHNEGYSFDTFCKNFVPDLFSTSFINLVFDSSKVRCSYDYDSSYFNAYPYLKTVSDLDKPRLAQIFVSFPLRNGEQEGNSAIIGFIETKSSYKFFGYSTIP